MAFFDSNTKSMKLTYDIPLLGRGMGGFLKYFLGMILILINSNEIIFIFCSFKNVHFKLIEMKTILVVLLSYLFLGISNIGFAQTNDENYNFEYIPAEGENEKEVIYIEKYIISCPNDFGYDPEFVGGHLALVEFIDSNFVFPKRLRKKNINGMLSVSFIVEKDGTLTNFKIKQKLHPKLDKEALRVVKLMPEWIPGEYGRMKMTIPFVFK